MAGLNPLRLIDQLSHFSFLEIFEGIHQFLAGVHHKRPIGGDRFPEGFTIEDHHFGLLIQFQIQGVTRPSEDDEVSLVNGLVAEGGFPGELKHQGIAAFREWKFQLG